MRTINFFRPGLLSVLALPLLAEAAPNNCPTASQVDKLTEKQTKMAKELIEQGGGFGNGGFGSTEDMQKIVTALDRCYTNRKGVPECLGRIYDRAEWLLGKNMNANRVPEENELNMRRPPDELLATDPNSSDKLMRLFQTEGGYKDAEQIAKEKGWPTVRYKSRHSGGFDSGTPSLLMIRVPGNKVVPPVDYDRYINIALPADPEDLSGDTMVNPVPKAKIPSPQDYENGNFNMPSTTTIVTVQKGKPGKASKVFFTLYRREGQLWRPTEDTANVSCLSCHPNGLRAISPLGFGVNPEQAHNGQVMDDPLWKAVREMNGAMELGQRNSFPEWGSFKDAEGKIRPLLNPGGLGPTYGPVKPLTRKQVTNPDGTKKWVSPTRQKEYIVGNGTAEQPGCAKSRDEYRLTDIFGRAPGRTNIYRLQEGQEIDWQKVTKAMNCASCHDGKTHGALTEATSFDTIAYKILVDQSMPLWAHNNPLDHASNSNGQPVTDELNLNERIALVSCLQAEFKEELPKGNEWLSGVSCARNPSNGPAGEATPNGPAVNEPGSGHVTPAH